MKKITESKVPFWMMSASRIQLILNIKNRLVAKFIDRMGFYDLSYVTFGYAKIDHDVKLLVAVYHSRFVHDQL